MGYRMNQFLSKGGKMLAEKEFAVELKVAIGDIRKKSYLYEPTIEDIINLEHVMLIVLVSKAKLSEHPKEQMEEHLYSWVSGYLEKITSINDVDRRTHEEIKEMVKEYQANLPGDYHGGSEEELKILREAIDRFHKEAKKDELSRDTLFAIKGFLTVVTSLKIFFEITFCEYYDRYCSFWADQAFDNLDSRFRTESLICERVLCLLMDYKG
jgi:hypothetical protein